jgi:hypothetical protein
MRLYVLQWHRTYLLRDAAKLGIVSGMTLLVNSVPVLLLSGLLAQSIVRSNDVKQSLRGAVLVVAICIAFLSPWIARNYVVFGTLVPFRQNTWIEIRQGNNPNGAIVQGRQSLHPNVLPREGIKYYERGERGYEADARDETVRYIKSHSGVTCKRLAIRAALFWFSDLFHEGVYGDRPWSHKVLREKMRDIVTFVWAVAPVLVVAIGSSRGSRRHNEMYWILTTPLMALPIPYYLSHIHPVYFGSVKPLLILLAGISLCELLRENSKRAELLMGNQNGAVEL